MNALNSTKMPATGRMSHQNGRPCGTTLPRIVLVGMAVAMALLGLTACNREPGDDAILSQSSAEAAAYWAKKYGETVTPSETYFPTRYSGESAKYVKSTVIVNMGGTEERDRLVMLDRDTGKMADNRQSDEIRKALTEHVLHRISDIGTDGNSADWATTASNLLSVMPSEYAPMDDAEWGEYLTVPPEDREWGTGTREEVDRERREEWAALHDTAERKAHQLVVNWEPLSIDYEESGSISMPSDDPDVTSHMFFSTKYEPDGWDGDAFMTAERKANGLRWDDTTDHIYIATGASEQIPGLHDPDAPVPSWKRAADSLSSWLDASFTQHPSLLVMPTQYALRGGYAGAKTLAIYPMKAGDGDATSRKPVIGAWQTVMSGDPELEFESNIPGISLQEGDASVTRLDLDGASLTRSLRESGYTVRDGTFDVIGSAYAIKLSESLWKRAGEHPIDANGADLGIQLDVRAVYEYDTDLSGTGAGSLDKNNPRLYVYRVSGVSDDGDIQGYRGDSHDPSAYPSITPPDGQAASVHMRRGEALVVFIATRKG